MSRGGAPEGGTVFLGCDDSGFAMKLEIIRRLEELGVPFRDCGSGPEPSRYPYYAARVAAAVSTGEARRGILVCGSGVGMSIAANKFPGVRAACVGDAYSARLTRRHNDSNVLCLGGQLLGSWAALEIVEVWLATEYDGGHHDGSLELLAALEAENFSGGLWAPDEPPYPPFDWDPGQKL